MDEDKLFLNKVSMMRDMQAELGEIRLYFTETPKVKPLALPSEFKTHTICATVEGMSKDLAPETLIKEIIHIIQYRTANIKYGNPHLAAAIVATFYNMMIIPYKEYVVKDICNTYSISKTSLTVPFLNMTIDAVNHWFDIEKNQVFPAKYFNHNDDGTLEEIKPKPIDFGDNFYKGLIEEATNSLETFKEKTNTSNAYGLFQIQNQAAKTYHEMLEQKHAYYEEMKKLGFMSSSSPMHEVPKPQGYGGFTQREISQIMPGLNAEVKPPCVCREFMEPQSVAYVIIHLNDAPRNSKCFRTREEIADWLESLDVDLTFPTPEEQEAREEEDRKRKEELKKELDGMKEKPWIV